MLMNKLTFAVSGLLSVIALSLSAAVFAQPTTLSDCQAIANRQARYACYDKWDASTGRVSESAPGDSNTAPAVAAQMAGERGTAEPQVTERRQEQERSLFSRIFNRDPGDDAAAETRATAGAPGAAADKSDGSQDVTRPGKDDNGESELIGRVLALEQPTPYVWVITLEGGQKWQQVTSKRYNLEKGDTVRIYPSHWGNNYRLSSEKAGGYIQVKRAY